MELELGVKLRRNADDSVTEFQIAKDRAGPVFFSRETETMFVLTTHLKGYKRSNIKIDINEDGSLIAISGEKRVQETVMVGWKMYKKDAEIKEFKKMFRIPDGVILDKIEARFNEDESTLTISMPKKVKGIRGTAIEEVKEKEQLVREGSGNLQIADEKISRTETLSQEKDERPQPCPEPHVPRYDKVEEPFPKAEDTEKVHDSKDEAEGIDKKADERRPNGKEVMEEIKSSSEESSSLIHDEVSHVGTEMPKEEPEDQKIMDETQEKTEPKQGEELQGPIESKDDQNECRDQVPEKEDEIHEEMEREEEKEESLTEKSNGVDSENEVGRVKEESKPREKRCNLMCTPIVAGSALLLSLFVFVIHIIRNKNQASSRKRD